MPKMYGKDKKGNYVKWGRRGKKYYYKKGNKRSRAAAKAKANRQAKAINANRNG